MKRTQFLAAILGLAMLAIAPLASAESGTDIGGVATKGGHGFSAADSYGLNVGGSDVGGAKGDKGNGLTDSGTDIGG